VTSANFTSSDRVRGLPHEGNSARDQSTLDQHARLGMRAQVDALKRRRILEEAKRLFFAQGYRGTTMEAIATALEMGKPFLYRHFRNKLELLVELYDEAIALSEEALDAALAHGRDETDIIRIFVEHYLHVVIHEREIVAVFFRENVNVPPAELARIDEHKRVFDRKLRAVIQRGIESGRFTVSDARLAAYAIIGMVNWSYQWFRENGPLTTAEIGKVFSQYAIRILTAPNQ